MEDGARGEDFSSQSVKTVSGYRRGADGRIRVSLSDGSSFFVQAAFFDSYPLHIGDAVSDGLEICLREENEYLIAQDKALGLLAQREHSTLQLSRKLRSRGFEDGTVSRVLTYLKESGFLDDSRFAESWVESRLRRKPEGYIRLVAGLSNRGVPRAIISDVLGRMLTSDEAESALERAAGNIVRRGVVDDTLLRKRLLSRGFSNRQIDTYLQNLK